MFRYGACSRGISQFHLHTHIFIPNRNEPYLPLPSQLYLVLICRPRRDGRLSRSWCEVAPAEIRTRNLPIASPALYHTATSASVNVDHDTASDGISVRQHWITRRLQCVWVYLQPHRIQINVLLLTAIYIGMAVLYYESNTGFSTVILPKCRSIWVKFGRKILLHGIHLWVQFYLDRCMGGSRPHENDVSFDA